MKSNKKSISLTYEEVKLLIECMDTSCVYLQDCNSRFRLLGLTKPYSNIILNGVNDIVNLSDKFILLLGKFENFNKEDFDYNE